MMHEFIHKKIDNNILIIQIDGALDGMSAPYLAIEHFSDESALEGVILDCSKISFLDSAGIAGIVKLFKHFQQLNITMILSALTDQPKSVIETLGLGSVITITDNMELAKKQL